VVEEQVELLYPLKVISLFQGSFSNLKTAEDNQQLLLNF
jgi:hypothetical protein